MYILVMFVQYKCIKPVLKIFDKQTCRGKRKWRGRERKMKLRQIFMTHTVELEH